MDKKMKEDDKMRPLLKEKKENLKGLDAKKKELLKRASGAATSKIDWNKVRDSWKYEED
jgi:hypothetical protein